MLSHSSGVNKNPRSLENHVQGKSYKKFLQAAQEDSEIAVNEEDVNDSDIERI